MTLMSAIFAVLLACGLGSFAGVLVYRLPLGISILKPRSSCETCHTELPLWDLVPLLSFFWLKGRCRFCGGLIRREIALIEIFCLILAMVCLLVFPDFLSGLCGILLGISLLALGWIDAKHYFLPDVIVIPTLLMGLLVTAWLHFSDLLSHVVGVLAGYMSLRLVNASYRIIRRRDGIGIGDAKLLALGGAWVGWQMLPYIMVLSASIGILGSVIWLLATGERLTKTSRIPFGSCLAPSIFAFYLIGYSDLLPRAIGM